MGSIYEYEPFFTTSYFSKGEGIKMMDELKSLLEKEQEPKKCHKCKIEMQLMYSPKTLHYDVNGEEYELSVENSPYHRCDNCDDNFENIVLYASVRKAIEKEIFLKLNNQEEIPKVMDLIKVVQK